MVTRTYKHTAHSHSVFDSHRFFSARTGMTGPQTYAPSLSHGDNIKTVHSASVEPYTTIAKSSYDEPYPIFSIGAFSSCASHLPAETTVGRYCSIGPNVSVMGWRHPIESVTQGSAANNRNREFVKAFFSDYEMANGSQLPWNRVPTPQPQNYLTIGNDVWIAANVIIASNITIGDGAVIASGSVVTKDVEPYSIVGGNPAKIIRYRYPRNIIQEMLEMCWWKYDYVSHPGR